MHRLGAFALRSSFRIRPRRVWRAPLTQRQPLHTGRSLWNDGSDREGAAPPSTHPIEPSSSAGTASNASADTSMKAPATESAVVETAAGDGPTGGEQMLEAESNAIADWLATLTDSTTSSQQRSELEEILEFEKKLKAGPPMTEAERKEGEEFLANPPPEFRGPLEKLEKELKRDLAKIFKEIESEPLPPGARPPAQDKLVTHDDTPLHPAREGFMAMGEAPSERYPDEPYEGDDITPLAHGQLDQHRDLREYMRIIAWEMPKLGRLVKPYTTPGPDRPLRFRFTSYMGEAHPAEAKVVVEFCTADLPLTPDQRLKLIKLLGARYNPQNDVAKLSCESFRNQAQNKRYLGDLVNTLIRTARGEGDAPEAKDSFADVPVDFRHVRWRKQLHFPEEWKMTDQRRAQLETRRHEVAAAEQKRVEEGSVVDGHQVIEESYQFVSALEDERAGRTLQGRMGRLQGKGRPARQLV